MPSLLALLLATSRDASEIDPNFQVRDSTGSGSSPIHETFAANHTNASKIGPQDQMITENLENELKRQHITQKFKAVASILQGHTDIDLLNEVPDSTGIGFSKGCHKATVTDPRCETIDLTITENLENQVVCLHWPKKKQNPKKQTFDERKRASVKEFWRK